MHRQMLRAARPVSRVWLRSLRPAQLTLRHGYAAGGGSGGGSGGGVSGGGGGGLDGGGFTDIRSDMWLSARMPAWLVPYGELARWDRPIGTWLLLWPCLWSIALAAPAGTPPDPLLCSLFAAGAVAMRGAGCTVNDLWDRDFDRRVERTRHRPLARGALQPSQALCPLASVGQERGGGKGHASAAPPGDRLPGRAAQRRAGRASRAAVACGCGGAG